jgi:hypothetical protein
MKRKSKLLVTIAALTLVAGCSRKSSSPPNKSQSPSKQTGGSSSQTSNKPKSGDATSQSPESQTATNQQADNLKPIKPNSQSPLDKSTSPSVETAPPIPAPAPSADVSAPAPSPSAQAPSPQTPLPTPLAQGPSTQSPSEKAPAGVIPNIPAPKTEPSNPETVTAIISPADDTTRLLTMMLIEVHPDMIEKARTQLINDVFSDEGTVQGKVVEIQASIAKLAKNDLYTPEIKNRVAFLQSRLLDRIKNDQLYDVLEKGVFFVGTGALLGTLAGTGAYRQIPQLGSSIRTGSQDALTSARAKIVEIYAQSRSTLQDLKAKVPDRESLNAALDRTKAKIKDVTDAAVQAGSRWRNKAAPALERDASADTLLRENLDDLGLLDYQRTAVSELSPVSAADLPLGLEFFTTPKSDFRFAVLDVLNGRHLKSTKVLVFEQQRIAEGNPFNSYYLTNRLPNEMVSSINSRLAMNPSGIETPERQFIHYMNLKTGAVSAMRWPVRKFEAMLQGASARIKPLFLNMDVPTAVGTGVASTAAMSVVYWYGYQNGEDTAQSYSAVNLEKMIPENHAFQSATLPASAGQ